MLATILAIGMTVFLALGSFGQPSAAAGTVEPLTIKFAHSGSQTHPYSVGLQKLMPILETASTSRLGREGYFGGTRRGGTNVADAAVVMSCDLHQQQWTSAAA